MFYISSLAYSYIFLFISQFILSPIHYPSGPFIYIYNLWLFYACINKYKYIFIDYIPPSDYKYIRIYNNCISDKIISLFMSLILLFCRGYYSIWFVFGSLLFTYLYSKFDLLHKQFPLSIENVGKKYIAPLIKTYDITTRINYVNRGRRNNGMGAGAGVGAGVGVGGIGGGGDASVEEIERLFRENEQRMMNQQRNSFSGSSRNSLSDSNGLPADPLDDVPDTAAVPNVEVSETNINSLLMLGFTREQCITALRTCNNDVDRAANLLLEGN